MVHNPRLRPNKIKEFKCWKRAGMGNKVHGGKILGVLRELQCLLIYMPWTTLASSGELFMLMGSGVD